MRLIIFWVSAFVLYLSCVSCGSTEVVECTDEKVWNVDKEVHNAFWGAINMLESHGANMTKYRYEDLDVFLVDELSGDKANSETVAMATWVNKDGIRIEVLRSEWEQAIYESQTQLAQENMLTMLHEIAHDLFNLEHYESEWDIMNSRSERGQMISQEDISNSIYRILEEARKVYDINSLKNRY